MDKENKEKITEISERLAEIIEKAGLTPNGFAVKLGYTRTQTIYDVLKGKSAPSYDFFRRFMLSEFSEMYNIDWLLTGRGEMYLPTIHTAMGMSSPQLVRLLEREKDVIYAPDFETSFAYKALSTIKGMEQTIGELTQRLEKSDQQNGKLTEKAASADRFYNTILEQAQEIGSLRAEIAQLERRLEKSATDASTLGIANVG